MTKNNKTFYQVAIPCPLNQVFDYMPPANCQEPDIKLGARVKVPFGAREVIGLVVAKNNSTSCPNSKLKHICEVLDKDQLFPPDLCSLYNKAAAYYHHPLGEVIFSGVPTPLRQGRIIENPASVPTSQKQPEPPPQLKPVNFELNNDQKLAIDRVKQTIGSFKSFLLEGITGSGKTEVYIQVAVDALNQNKSVLILVPEISLTQQTLDRFASRTHMEVLGYHSRMTPVQRYKVWLKARYGNPCIIIGTRSAVFLPFTNLGLIVVDEEHDISYKQDSQFRYHARDIALMRGQLEKFPVLLGSATPSFESLKNCNSEKFINLKLNKRTNEKQLPQINLIDMRHIKTSEILSPQSTIKIKQHLENNGQALLFINRRGYAPVFICFDCGEIANCPNCNVRLTYHKRNGQLRCHHCLYLKPASNKCPSCQSENVKDLGIGTQKLEDKLKELFPQETVLRIDSDSTRKKGELETCLSMAQNREAGILIGTQMLAKGHHFPHLSLVAILDLDSGLFSSDFRAIERMAQLFVQVAGRAGRAHKAGEVIIQTFHPQHPLLQQLINKNYNEFSKQLLQERQRCLLPPFSHIALVHAEAKSSALAEQFLQDLNNKLSQQNKQQVTIYGPIPAPFEKRQGKFRFQIMLQAQERRPLHHLLSFASNILEGSRSNKASRGVRWALDVDPLEMI